MVGLLGCERTLLGHIEFLVNQYPQVLLSRAALKPFIPQPVLVLGCGPQQGPQRGAIDEGGCVGTCGP